MTKKLIFIAWLLSLSFAAEQLCGQCCADGKSNDGDICSAVDKLLYRVEQAGAKLASFQADMLYNQLQPIQDTVIIRHGRLYYQVRGETVRARINFDDFLQQDTDEEEKLKPQKFDEDYVFDGLWLTASNSKTKKIDYHEISKKSRGKEDFRIGNGPFPLPFAIKRKDVLKHFDVKITKADPNAPAVLKDSDHIALVPKKKSPYIKDYRRLELWVSKKTALPVRISFEKELGELTTITWSNIKVNKKIRDATFKLKKPGKGWTEDWHPLKEKNDAKKVTK